MRSEDKSGLLNRISKVFSVGIIGAVTLGGCQGGGYYDQNGNWKAYQHDPQQQQAALGLLLMGAGYNRGNAAAVGVGRGILDNANAQAGRSQVNVYNNGETNNGENQKFRYDLQMFQWADYNGNGLIDLPEERIANKCTFDTGEKMAFSFGNFSGQSVDLGFGIYDSQMNLLGAFKRGPIVSNGIFVCPLEERNFKSGRTYYLVGFDGQKEIIRSAVIMR